MKVILNGRFDILHSGHFNLLNYARRYAGLDGEVMVAIDTDERISKQDSKLPIFSQDERIVNLQILRCLDMPMVNKVTLFTTDDDLIQIIKAFKPDYMVKGSDWANKPVIGSDIIPMIIWYPVEKNGVADKISSSDVINKILEKHGYPKNS